MRRGWILAALSTLAGCSRACLPSDPKSQEAVLILGTTQEPSTLDPAFAVRSGEQEIVRLLFQDLTGFDDRAQVVPRLARTLPEVSTSTGGRLHVTWSLREARWSDGTPVTTADVLLGHEVEANEALEAVSHDVARRVAAIRSEGPRKFTVTWREPFRGVSDPRVHAVLPAHAYPASRPRGFRGVGRDASVTNGPFRVERWTPGQSLIMTRNPFWKGPRPGLDKLVFRFFPSDDAFETELAAGGIHALGAASGLGIALARRLGERFEDTHVVEAKPSGLLLQLGLRLDHPLLARAEVRRALHEAVDRPRLAELVYGGWASPAYGLYGPAHPAHRSRAEVTPSSPGSTLRDLFGKEPLLLTFAAGSEAAERAAVVLEDTLESAGFTIELQARPFPALFEAIQRGTQSPLSLFAFRTRPDWAGTTLLKTGGRLNSSGYSHPDVDRWLTEAERTPNVENWVGVLHRIENQVMEDLPLVPLLFRHEVSLRPRQLEGWRPTGTTTPVTWNAEAWHWRR
ncbi:MAG: ABC transporter substrate-binding protein [Myxococcota bacterium]